MLRFLLTPRWLAIHAVAAIGLIGCLLLGQWQWGTYENSQARQQTRDQAAEPLSTLVQPGEPLGEAADRRVRASGEYVTSLVVPGRVSDNTLGDLAAATLQTEHGQVLVVRGWTDAAEELAAPTGEVTVEGHLLPPETAGHATDPSAPEVEGSTIAYLDPELARRAGSTDAPFYDGYLLLSEEQAAPPGGVAPIPVPLDEHAPVHDVSPWQNLSYGAQWWVFAAAVVLFWASVVRGGIRSRRAQTVTTPETSPAPSA